MRRSSLLLIIAMFIMFIGLSYLKLCGRPSVSTLVSRTQYEQLFPNHVPFYSYDGFVRGGDATPGFCTTGSSATQIRECAAFLANAAHETGGGVHIVEVSRYRCPEYCDETQTGPCAPEAGQSYYGRGWLQISWNYNYCAASKFIYGDDGRTLVRNPSILERDAKKATQASLWYWMTQKGLGAMPAHECITSGAGFGCTIRAINVALECDGGNMARVRLRIENYKRFLQVLGNGTVQPVGPNDC